MHALIYTRTLLKYSGEVVVSPCDLGSVVLTSSNTVIIPGKKNAIEVSTADTTFFMYADTEKEKDEWIGAIGRAIVQVKIIMAAFSSSFSSVLLSVVALMAGLSSWLYMLLPGASSGVVWCYHICSLPLPSLTTMT
jgi:hypothetical protein